MPSENLEIDVEKLQRIIEESFSKDKNGKLMHEWSIIPSKSGNQFFVDFVCADWCGGHLSELNKFAINLCRKGIIKRSSNDFWACDSKDLWIYEAFSKKEDYIGLGITIDVTNTRRSLRPRPKTKTTIELKPNHEPVIFVDKEGGLGMTKEEEMKKRARQHIRERDSQG